ncbi:MAG: hypothetical protein U0326_44145 [Polyangiales bacterium]
MALRDLSTPVMVSLTSTWVDHNHGDHAALCAQPQSAGLVSSVEASHSGLLAVQVSTTESASARLVEVKADQTAVSQRHDRMIHGVWWYLSAVAVLTPSAERAAELTALRDRLLPDGLSLKNTSYRDKIGAASLAHARLTREDRALLASLRTPVGTLDDAVSGWFAEAARLGELEHERATIEPQGTAPADVLKARNNWVRTIAAVRAALFLVEELPLALAQLLQRVEDAEHKAAPRGEAQPVVDTPTGNGATPANDTHPAHGAQPAAPANDTHAAPVARVA